LPNGSIPLEIHGDFVISGWHVEPLERAVIVVDDARVVAVDIDPRLFGLDLDSERSPRIGMGAVIVRVVPVPIVGVVARIPVVEAERRVRVVVGITEVPVKPEAGTVIGSVITSVIGPVIGSVAVGPVIRRPIGMAGMATALNGMVPRLRLNRRAERDRHRQSSQKSARGSCASHREPPCSAPLAVPF
jgi:hypothetical protein